VWKNPVKSTPSIVQIDFGAYGQDLPGDGEQYCAPTSAVMGLYWLSANGFTQVAPATYGGQADPAAINLELVMAGLAQTSSVGGTQDLIDAVSTYLSACGIAPDQYTLTTPNIPTVPLDIDWLATQLAPNVAQDPDTIALVAFWVGWFSRPNKTSTVFTNNGGHTLAPLTADPAKKKLTLNNAYPSTFENVPNLPDKNPQTVTISSVPSGWTLPGLGPSQDYSEVVSETMGTDLDFAILWGAAAWTISLSALPSSSGYQLSPWVIEQAQLINTNDGVLTVLAPLAGAGGFDKEGEGTLLLTNLNKLTGANTVNGGTLASALPSGLPFGSGAMSLAGGSTLLLFAESAVEAAIASDAGAAFTIGDGGGTLQLLGDVSYLVTIGGNKDGTTPNIARATAGNLVIAASGGVAGLGDAQQIVVAGTGDNTPGITNGIVAPYILGQDNDEAGSGAFLTYDNVAGFKAAATVSSADIGINQVSSDAVYRVVGDQAIDPGGMPQVAALEVDGSTVNGFDGGLLVGSQAGGDIAGVILNGADLLIGFLLFGDAESVIYASDANAAIAAVIAGTAGLTVCGPGTLALTADSSTSLAGQVNVNSGTLVAAGAEGSCTGSGEVVVNSAAVLEVTGIVGGPVSVDQSGTLFLNGGTVQGGVTVAPVGATTADPGGILQGGGTISSAVSISGVIKSGPQPGIIEFTDTVSVSGDACFFWRLQSLVDNNTSKPGVGWNALQFDSAESFVGIESQGMTYFLDFSALAGDPDGGDPFWHSSHSWSLMIYAGQNGTAWWDPANFFYKAGSFSLAWDGWTVVLTWGPASEPQSLAQRRTAQIEARKQPQPGHGGA
jgi:autotransporter-associated beta strand protein